MAGVDAHVIAPHEYDDAPDLSEFDPVHGVLEIAGKPARGRPALGDAGKRQITLRLDPEVIERFKAQGRGWQGQINAFLKANELIVNMIAVSDVSVRDLEELIKLIQSGGIRSLTASVKESIAKVEANIRMEKEMSAGLRRQLFDKRAPVESERSQVQKVDLA